MSRENIIQLTLHGTVSELAEWPPAHRIPKPGIKFGVSGLPNERRQSQVPDVAFSLADSARYSLELPISSSERQLYLYSFTPNYHIVDHVLELTPAVLDRARVAGILDLPKDVDVMKCKLVRELQRHNSKIKSRVFRQLLADESGTKAIAIIAKAPKSRAARATLTQFIGRTKFRVHSHRVVTVEQAQRLSPRLWQYVRFIDSRLIKTHVA